MTEQTLPRRKNPPITLLIGVFITTLVISGVVIFVILDTLIEEPPATTIYDAELAVIESDTRGVSTINPAREVTDFTLTSHTGDPLSLSDLRGRYVLIYFGYTHCPDVCPLTLMDFQQVNEQLGADAENMAYLFVSVDGERDTPEKIARYFETRGITEMMLGMQGEDTVLRQISPDYGLYYEAQPVEENGYYAVDHTANTFLLDPEGRLSHIFAFGTEPEVMTDTIQALIGS